MEVIDKILNEWSFRCHDGIVDMHNPKKVSILKEILIEEGIEDDIVDAILNLPKDDPSSEEKKQKVLNYLTGGSDEKDKEIEKLRQQVGGSKEKKQAIIQKLEIKNIPPKVSRFIVFAYGDVQLGDENIEVKQSSKSSKNVFQGAIISDLGRSNDYKTLWNSKVLDNGQSFREKYGFEKLLSTWTPIYKKYKEVSDKDRYVEDLKKVMKTGDFDNVDEITKKDFEGTDPQNFYKKIAYCSVGEYLKDKLLVLMNSNLDYVYLNEEEYKKAILNNPQIYANNAFSPRISYIEKIEDEPEKVAKLKLSAPKKAQQKVKGKEEEIETEIEEDSKTQELKQAFEKAEQELKDKKSKEPNRQFTFLEDKLKKAREEYQNYLTKRKEELSRVREDLKDEIEE